LRLCHRAIEKSPDDPITESPNGFGYQQVRGGAVRSRRCLAKGNATRTPWKPGWRVMK
jgi:hypothetical protein